jgi:hypothetical protein
MRLRIRVIMGAFYKTKQEPCCIGKRNNTGCTCISGTINKTPEETQTVEEQVESLATFWGWALPASFTEDIKQALKTAEARGHTEGLNKWHENIDDIQERAEKRGHTDGVRSERERIVFDVIGQSAKHLDGTPDCFVRAYNHIVQALTPTDVTDKD